MTDPDRPPDHEQGGHHGQGGTYGRALRSAHHGDDDRHQKHREREPDQVPAHCGVLLGNLAPEPRLQRLTTLPGHERHGDHAGVNDDHRPRSTRSPSGNAGDRSSNDRHERQQHDLA